MGKIIIENRTDMDDAFCVGLALDVIRGGRISNDGKQYCYLSTVEPADTGTTFAISSFLNKKSDRLVVWEYPK